MQGKDLSSSHGSLLDTAARSSQLCAHLVASGTMGALLSALCDAEARGGCPSPCTCGLCILWCEQQAIATNGV